MGVAIVSKCGRAVAYPWDYIIVPVEGERFKFGLKPIEIHEGVVCFAALVGAVRGARSLLA